MLIEIHTLKNYPATNLNRDDTGAPKTCIFGGTTRGRISSQCLKRSWRTSDIFRNALGEENLGYRTRKLPSIVVEELVNNRGIDAEFAEIIKPSIATIAKKDEKASGEKKKDKDDFSLTPQIVFYSKDDIDIICDMFEQILKECKSIEDVKKAVKGKDIKNKFKDVKTRPVTVDIALFGRMVTSDAFRNVDASVQVAHAISTNKVVLESDFYTAMDDLLSGESMKESGSGMMGDVDFNSSCYYSYVSLDTDELLANLSYCNEAEKLMKNTVLALIEAIAFTNPSGKQNSFAGNILPSAIMIECKEKKIPVSYVNAYSEAIYSKNIVEDSINKLVEECNMNEKDFGIPVKKRIWFTVDKYKNTGKLNNATMCSSFPELMSELKKVLE